MEWAQILVITLAVALAIFLVLAIILTIKLIQISRQIRRITNTAERAAVKVESVVNSAAAMVAPAAIAKIIRSMMNKSTRKHKNKED